MTKDQQHLFALLNIIHWLYHGQMGISSSFTPSMLKCPHIFSRIMLLLLQEVEFGKLGKTGFLFQLINSLILFRVLFVDHSNVSKMLQGGSTFFSGNLFSYEYQISTSGFLSASKWFSFVSHCKTLLHSPFFLLVHNFPSTVSGLAAHRFLCS